MSLRSCIKGKSSRPNCFHYYTLDNHADICIFCNASLLTSIRPAEHRVNELAKRRPIDSAKFFEFKSTLAYGPEDQEDVERVTVQPGDRRSVIQPQSVQSDPISIPSEIVQPVQAQSLGTTGVSSSSPRLPVLPMSQRASPHPSASPMYPVNPRRVSFGPAPASPAPVHKPPTPVKDYGRGRREQIPNRQMGPYQVNSVYLNKVYSLGRLGSSDHGRCKVAPRQQSFQRSRSEQESVCHDGSSR